jgi:hypothetical protein
MIEMIICNYLSTKLDCQVLPEKPKRPFGRMVFVERTGGNGRFIRNTTIAIQSYGTSMYEAAELNEEVIRAMESIWELNEVVKVDLNQNYNFTDTTTKEYRYQAVFDVKHY